MGRITPRRVRFVGTPAVALLAALALSFSAGCRGKAVAQSTAHFRAGTGFVHNTVDLDGQSHPMWVFLPKDYDPARRYPTILFLHGLFEAGSDGSGALSGGLGPVIAQNPERWPFIVLFPQSSGTWRGEARERLALRSLDWAEQRYAIDRSRVILAGLSYGGLGTWQIGARHAGRFAALVPVAGFGDLDSADELRDVPVWAFHRRHDPFVHSQGSQQMCAQIDQLGGRARYTAFDGVGHDCWDRAVAQTDLVDWMLRQRTRTATDARAAVSFTE
jgi:predicted peptidase